MLAGGRVSRLSAVGSSWTGLFVDFESVDSALGAVVEFPFASLPKDFLVIKNSRLELFFLIIKLRNLKRALDIPVTDLRDSIASSGGRFRAWVSLAQILECVECSIEVGVIAIALAGTGEQ